MSCLLQTVFSTTHSPYFIYLLSPPFVLTSAYSSACLPTVTISVSWQFNQKRWLEWQKCSCLPYLKGKIKNHMICFPETIVLGRSRSVRVSSVLPSYPSVPYNLLSSFALTSELTVQ